KGPDVLLVPLEAVSNEDSSSLVYRLSGARATKQQVVTGAMNDDEVVIARGLAEGDRVLLTLPPGHERLKLARLPAADAAKPASVTAGATTPPPTPPANQDCPVRWDREARARLRGRISAPLEVSVRTAVEAGRHHKLRASPTPPG